MLSASCDIFAPNSEICGRSATPVERWLARALESNFRAEGGALGGWQEWNLWSTSVRGVSWNGPREFRATVEGSPVNRRSTMNTARIVVVTLRVTTCHHGPPRRVNSA